MEYQAIAKYQRVSPRKARLVAEAVKQLTPTAALAQLSRLPQLAAGQISRVLASAIANAKHKGAMVESLHIQALDVTGGPAMKRWQAVKSGSAHAYKKRMSHIRVVLSDEEGSAHGAKS